MVETALGSAMKRAGVNTNEAMLLSVAVDELRKAGWDAKRALGPFTAEVRDAGGMMAELHSYAETRDRAWVYLLRRVADKQGEGLKIPAKAGDGVQIWPGGQASRGPVEEKSGGGGVQSAIVGQPRHGASSPLDDKTGEGGVQTEGESRFDSSAPFPVAEKVGEDRVQGECDGHLGDGASAPTADSAGEGVQVRCDSHDGRGPSPAETNAEGGSVHAVPAIPSLARPSATPNKPRGLVAMQTLRAVDKSILEMRVLYDGVKYGEARWQTLLSRADRLLRESIGNVREAALMYVTYNHARPPHFSCQVKDVIKPDTARDLTRKADRITPDALAILIKRAAETTEAIDA